MLTYRILHVVTMKMSPMGMTYIILDWLMLWVNMQCKIITIQTFRSIMYMLYMLFITTVYHFIMSNIYIYIDICNDVLVYCIYWLASSVTFAYFVNTCRNILSCHSLGFFVWVQNCEYNLCFFPLCLKEYFIWLKKIRFQWYQSINKLHNQCWMIRVGPYLFFSLILKVFIATASFQWLSVQQGTFH